MTDQAPRPRPSFWNPIRLAAWSVPIGLLILPAVAMRFTDEVAWTASDFIVAAGMFIFVGGMIELALRLSDRLAYRLGVGVAVMTTFVTFWANGAVGFVGDEGNPLNMWFYVVPLVAMFGVAFARFKAQGMGCAMVAAAAAQVGVGVYALTQGAFTPVLTGVFTALWVLSASLFREASKQETQA